MLRIMIVLGALLTAPAALAQASRGTSQPAPPHSIIFDPLYNLLSGKQQTEPNKPAPQKPQKSTAQIYYGNGLAVPPQNLPASPPP